MRDFRLVFDPVDGSVVDPKLLEEAHLIMKWLSHTKVAAPYRLAKEMGISLKDAERLMGMVVEASS